MLFTQYSFVIVFIWAGFVGAISFMESWVKFRAPSVTREIALDVGRTVFRALNRVEIVFAILVVAASVINQAPIPVDISITVALLGLAVQTAYLLPRLDLRAQQLLAGQELRPSKIHLIYVVLEGLKVPALLVHGILQIRFVLGL
jgi:hypothetical protein